MNEPFLHFQLTNHRNQCCHILSPNDIRIDQYERATRNIFCCDWLHPAIRLFLHYTYHWSVWKKASAGRFFDWNVYWNGKYLHYRTKDEFLHYITLLLLLLKVWYRCSRSMRIAKLPTKRSDEFPPFGVGMFNRDSTTTCADEDKKFHISMRIGITQWLCNVWNYPWSNPLHVPV